ncbi:MAG: NGG1p interacting factor NIF3 [Candidatus Margulisiibacteriota bacterium]
MYKLVVFIPEKALDKVRKAVCSAGAGKIGRKYDNCSFYTKGTGTFRPLKGARPYIGKVGKLEKVNEYRLETIVSKELLKKVIAAMKEAHPYEEPAYDIYPLKKA